MRCDSRFVQYLSQYMPIAQQNKLQVAQEGSLSLQQRGQSELLSPEPNSCIPNFGHWNKKENLKYYLFVYHHEKQILDQGVRRSLQLFKGMSRFIRTRTSAQCRTHHQKIIHKHGSLSKAIRIYRSSFLNFLQLYEKISPELSAQAVYSFCCDFDELNVEKGKEVMNLSEKLIDRPTLKDLFAENQSQDFSFEGQQKEDLHLKSPRESDKVSFSENAHQKAPASNKDPTPNLQERGRPIRKNQENNRSPASLSQEWTLCHAYFIRWLCCAVRLNGSFAT